jgi:hypothetical protein
MPNEKPISEQALEQARQKAAEERQKLVVQTVKLPNGATFTKLRPVAAG